jgi:hypothetical protein
LAQERDIHSSRRGIAVEKFFAFLCRYAIEALASVSPNEEYAEKQAPAATGVGD